ncbi:bifunctional diaminohydroxyphosphoribosylaminopyrimidine deaminase/5-amino-6-(5-phosphoribosylamino)uracil reductase RibD [Ramlibacter tataouinensis]|uniref:bifunctional diaminohydroxyphosphoribosylaminopyrimidine deaminase/5-amino-6-(5-phosphoribosylamino)uracil reductase RibD n=1 Tax=Ramlibacter tataouinensis TaxID=94132 RepID=UPI0022F400F2|nr:bifunctional diaminohydroxyphosphoribosylaminopyrimidine deaminase/5-amino-6-(5-phosphoribosylamino)uracil reductase RibD [Ramlibacter tataouinensis]WBY01575.1 bifunctional diaminohydroxyphosphoribosylaminopyrimidine deaminase/5-amino-6-(5-phosphoribosylamino)uracil reductase RibD [Ramlibacter tataouinensis]
MQQALALARRSLGLSEPNPRVGCVLVAPDGAVIGQGHTQEAGGPHAEVMALRDAAAAGHDVRGATAYVTLEPCAHQGRTGPCCDALIDAGIARVVAATGDPNPLVGGRGFERLRAAGIEVQVGPGAEQSRELNIGFFSRMERGIPWVRLKVAASLDGRTALDDGRSQWITAEAARADGHAWRARAGAVLTGIGTVLQDDPLLDARLAGVARQPPLALVDSRLEVPLTARLFGPQRRLWIYTAQPPSPKWLELQERGAKVVSLPGPGGKVDLAAVLRDLAARDVNELHVEAGHKLNGSLLREGLVDELLVYLAPRLIGPGQPMAHLAPLASLAQALPLRFTSVEMVGEDLRVLARVTGRAGA